MSIDRKDYQELLSRQGSLFPGPRFNKASLEVAERDAVSAELLTGNPEWDRFLTFLQAAYNRIERVRVGTIETLLLPYVVEADAIMRAKLIYAESHGQLAILESIMRLPAELKSNGEKARDLLAEFGEKDVA